VIKEFFESFLKYFRYPIKKFWLLIVIVFASAINLFAEGKTAVTIYNSNN
jgi:hypothetical protein